MASGIDSAGRKPKSTPNVAGYTRKLARWGNSLGVRIPQEAVDQLSFRDGEEVRIEINDESLTIRPIRRKWSEAELLEGVTPDMVGGEVDWGDPVGKEIW